MTENSVSMPCDGSAIAIFIPHLFHEIRQLVARNWKPAAMVVVCPNYAMPWFKWVCADAHVECPRIIHEFHYDLLAVSIYVSWFYHLSILNGEAQGASARRGQKLS